MTIEDCIEFLAQNIDIRSSDIKLINSFANQCKKNIALTDRQHELAKQKILDYKEELEIKGFENIKECLNNLRNPHRIIDRSKTVKLVSKSYADFFETTTTTMLAIRFPFSKKMIKHIELINKLQDSKEFDKTTKTHFLEYTEKNVMAIVDALKDSNFDIQLEILEYYNKVKLFITDANRYMPGVYNYELRNVHNKCRDYAVNLLGHPCEKNLALYYDRRDTLGLKHFNQEQLLKSINTLQFKLSKLIAEANTALLHLPPSEFSVTDLVDALWELNRFPVLVKLKTNHEKEDLYNFYEAAIKYVNPTDISVLFRLDSTSQQNIDFNTAIKELGLNNPLHDNTKMVFLNFNKIPKPLLKNNWKPETTILMESTRFSSEKISRLYDEFSNLIIHYDSALNYFMKRKNHTVITNII